MLIDHALLNEIVKYANKLGQEGTRVKSVAVLPAQSGADRISYIFETDNGPKSAMELW